MINQRIVEIIEDLGIPCYYRHAPLILDDYYCIFSIYQEKDESCYDNFNRKTKYYIMINFWCKEPMYLSKYQEIKNKLRSLKKECKIRQINDLEDSSEGFYGKSFNVEFIEWNWEQE